MSAIEPPVRRDGCPPAGQLEFLAAGDAVPKAVTAHLLTCQTCSAYVTGLRGEQVAYTLAHPPELMLRKLQRRHEAERGRRRWGWLGAFAALGAMVLGAVLLRPAESGLTLKAGSGFSVYSSRSASTAPRPLASGARVSAGDVLRFQFTSKQSGYLMILDLDGADQLTAFQPYRGQHAIEVRAGQTFSPDELIQLDSSPGPERVVAIFRPLRFSLADVTGWLGTNRATPGIPLLECGDCTAEWVVLEKP